MIKKGETRKGEELRSEVRKAASNGASVEFKPSIDTMTYQFKLRDWSASGLGVLAKKESDIFNHIEVGQIFAMKVHKGDAGVFPELLNVEIRHISEPVNGQPANHFVIGLYIVDRIQDNSLDA